jgi:predicted ester cyclase
VEYNGVSMISENCKKSLMKIMLIPPNGKRLDFHFVVLNVL